MQVEVEDHIIKLSKLQKKINVLVPTVMNSIKSSLEVDDTELQRKNKLNNATNLNDLYIDRCRGVVQIL